MLLYMISKFKKSLKVPTALNIINTTNLSRKKRNAVLAKAGIIFNGESAIMSPFFFEKGRIEVGEQVYVNANCTFLDHEKISIGCHTLIGPNVTLTTADHQVDPEHRNKGIISKPITIGKNVWLGAGVVVLPGVTIGDNSVVAANSVVRSDIEPGSLYAGAPAKFKRFL